MKKLVVAAVGLGVMISSVYATSVKGNVRDELQASQWSVMKEKRDETVYYRTSDVGSKSGIWLKSVEKKDNDTEYKHYVTDCSGKNAVVKDIEVDVKKSGELKQKDKNSRVKKAAKADAIRSLICGK